MTRFNLLAEGIFDRFRRLYLHLLGQILLLLQCSPQLEEMERFAAQVIKRRDPNLAANG